MSRAKEILKQYWGFEEFRPLQEEITQSAVYGHDTLALLPTGGGKSICFQVPGLMREGLTLVISPLIALMNDQVNNLKKKGIKAIALYSGLSARDIDILLDHAVYGDLQFLYVSPERLQTAVFIERFKKMKVGLIVVDEAHCISEWGHDFRPSYKKISELRPWQPSVPIIALTATATPKVQNDIIQYLELKNPQLFVADFKRKNLTFRVESVEDKMGRILHYIQENRQLSGIIYCQTRRSVKEVARVLIQHRLSAGIYHGGMGKEDRDRMMEEWMSEKTKVMVATNAFGMGIDKPNVRYVLHYEMSNNLEAYYQEAGRAGRDGHAATAIAFLAPGDTARILNQFEETYPAPGRIQQTYRALCGHLEIPVHSGLDESYELDVVRWAEKYQSSTKQLYADLKALELNGNVVFNTSFFTPTKAKFNIGNKELYSFQLKYAETDDIISTLSRTYAGINQSFVPISERNLAVKLQLSEKKVVELLTFLEAKGVMDVSWANQQPTVTFLQDRPHLDQIFGPSSPYFKLKRNAESRVIEMVKYLETNSCRSLFLINYFGQKGLRCGICDNCEKENAPAMTVNDIRIELIKKLDQPKTLQALYGEFGTYRHQIDQILQEFLLSKKVVYQEEHYRLNDRSTDS